MTSVEVDALVRGDVLTLPRSTKPELTADSDIVVMFAETDQALAGRFPPGATSGVTDGRMPSRKPAWSASIDVGSMI
jgi:hypothetical protein